jgi:hypothetical protein
MGAGLIVLGDSIAAGACPPPSFVCDTPSGGVRLREGGTPMDRLLKAVYFADIAAFLPLYLVRVPREEQMMLDHSGDAYRAYCARTGRILPRLRDLLRR